VEGVAGVARGRTARDANDRAVATDEREMLPCGLVFRSVGYRGVEVPEVAFDAVSGTIPNEGGRVEPGVYVAGWIKRGPTGVIGTNKKDATETVDLLLEDAAAGRLRANPEATAAAVDELLAERGIPVVEYAGWTSIDEVERGAGEKSGRPRVKLCSWDELLAVAERLRTPRSCS
jgi:ferredoxin--NADP+ reductase